MTAVGIVAGAVGLLYVLVSALGLFLPRVGDLTLGRFAPYRYADPAQRRLALRLWAAQIGIVLAYSVYFLLSALDDRVAPTYRTGLVAVQGGLLLVAIGCMVASTRLQRQLIAVAGVPAPVRSPRSVRLIVGGLALALLLGALVFYFTRPR